MTWLPKELAAAQGPEPNRYKTIQQLINCNPQSRKGLKTATNYQPVFVPLFPFHLQAEKLQIEKALLLTTLESGRQQ